MSDIETMRAVLEEPFPASKIKRRQGGRGQMFDYIAGEDVIRRLNDATGGCWDLAIKDITQQPMGTNTLVLAHVALTIPGMGTREHIGVQSVSDRGGEDLVKGAVTDALKKAATLFGVALHLYGDGDGDAEPSGPPPANRQQPPRRPAPQSPRQAPQQQAPPRQQQAAPAADDDEYPQSWSAFWPKVRALGLNNKRDLDAAIGRSADGLQPAELYGLVMESLVTEAIEGKGNARQ